MKKTILAILTLATLAASPALAQSTDHGTRSRGMAAHARAAGGEAGGVYENYSDPYAVIVGNSLVGRDPDINIRLQLQRDVPSDN